MDKFEELMKTVKAQEALGVAKANDFINAVKANEFLNLRKKEEEKKKCNKWAWAIGIILGVAAIAAIAYGLYCYFTPDYLEDFEDDLDDDLNDEFDDEFFEDETDAGKKEEE